MRIPDDIRRILDALAERRHEVDVTGVPPGAAAYVVARAAVAQATPMLVVVADAERGRAMTEALNAFLPAGAPFPATTFYPDQDVSPYAGISPSRALAMERLGTLFRLGQGLAPRIVVAPVNALGLYTVPRDRLGRIADVVMAGETLDRERFLRNLVAAGYQNAPVVEDPGSFAVRGGLVDVFSPLYEQPARIDLWGDEVETIRTFDPESQRSEGQLEELFVVPAREALLDDEGIRRGLGELRRLADAADMPTARVRELSEDLRAGILGVGMEFLLPSFYGGPETLLDYLPAGTTVVLEQPDELGEQANVHFARLESQYEAPASRELLAFEPARHLRPPHEVLLDLRARPRIQLHAVAVEEELLAREPVRLGLGTHEDLIRDLTYAPGGERSLKPLADYLRAAQVAGLVCALCCHTDGQADRLRQLLGHYGLGAIDQAEPPHIEALDAIREDRNRVHLFRGALGAGFRHDAGGLLLVDEEEILGRKKRRARQRALPKDLVPQLGELNPGDLVVHVEHGIGRFLGLEKLQLGGDTSDFLRVEYGNGGSLLLPVHNLDRIQRYVGSGESAPSLDRLGGVAWQRRKTRVRKAVRAMADDLLKLYAARAARVGHAFSPPDETLQEFEATFPYDETPDQSKAIDDVMDDMGNDAPMDRLVCGDVGYGKTEVAMRAAFRAVADGLQVAVLVPTTVLAEQHRMTFESRMGPHGVLVDSLSRFKSDRQQRDVLTRLAEGRLDVLVGTHRLLSKDIEFARLGLLVIDEEHRFGVAHKERLKQLKEDVDVLTLTATPIPRTLSMALSGIRDLSIIATAPQDRLSVRTMVTRGTDEVVTEGIRRELARGGQVFFVHNRVESIYRRAEHLQALVPEARVEVAHAQLDERSLERIMLRFVKGEVNVLVCTTIIESGLDIPNANTLFVDRADRFGLAQLYQLRGRIGRGRERAYAYLLIPNPATLAGDARRRISVIQRFSDLGSGFHIATHDLEIRGAGNMLGADQSGHVEAVGYDLFVRMLEEAVQEMRGEERPPLPDPELRIELPAYLPDDWLPEPQERVRLYRRLAGARTAEELEALEDELADRFGAPPTPVRNLIETLHAKRTARMLGLREVVYGPGSLVFTLHEEGLWTPESIVSFLNRPNNRYRLTADMQLTRTLSKGEWDEGMRTLRGALKELLEYANRNSLR